MTMLPNLSEGCARIVVHSADMVQDGAGMVILSVDMVFHCCVFYVFLAFMHECENGFTQCGYSYWV